MSSCWLGGSCSRVMPTVVMRAVAMRQGLIMPPAAACCKHCPPNAQPASSSFSCTSPVSTLPPRRRTVLTVGIYGELAAADPSSAKSLYSSISPSPSPLRRNKAVGGGNDTGGLPLRDLRLVLNRTLAGRAHGRAAAVSARVSTSFSTEEAALVEGSGGNALVGVGDEEEELEAGSMRRLPGSNIVLDVNMGRRHLIKQVEFVKSSPRESECPKDGLPEFALVGRSNVGKSSLVNALVNRKDIAQTSKTPGKTQLINHFRVNGSWHLVDLPGYGYAKAPVVVKTEWNDFTKAYFLNRKTLVAVLLLVDGSIPPLKIDLDCADWLGRNKIPVTIVFTKCDRRKKKKNGGKPPDENVREFEKQLQESYAQTPPWIMTSSVTGQGKDELLKHLTRLLDYWSN